MKFCFPKWLYAVSLAVAFTVSSSTALAVQGYVSGQLLKVWCADDAALPTEACLSYLRGAFDGMQAYEQGRIDEEAAVVEQARVCVPRAVSVTELRIIARRHLDRPGINLGKQASVLLMRAWRERYPCDT